MLSSSDLSRPQDSQLLQQVVGDGGTGEGYLYGGFTTFLGICASLFEIDRPLENFSNILDFGCGSGRVVHWVRSLCPNANLQACDINPPAIDWCKANLKGIDFLCNPEAPPLPYGDQSFDLIFGISVVTHLDETRQNAWLAELRRISMPNAIVMLSIHGEDKARMSLPGQEFDQYSATGFLYKTVDLTASLDGLPDFYQVAFHSAEYVSREWSKYFDILGSVRHGPFYEQELVIMRRKGPAGRNHGRTAGLIDLPLACLDAPDVGHRVAGGRFEVSGWAFLPSGPDVLDVTLWVDGHPAATFQTGSPRPDVGSAFANNVNAGSAGFSAPVEYRTTPGAPHAVWLSMADNPFPLCATFVIG